MPDLPDDIAALKTALAAAEQRADLAEADAAHAKATASGIEALVAHLTLQIEKLKRELYGTRSERTARLLDQLEMQLEDAEAALTEDELAAEAAAAKTTVASFERRRRGGRKPFPSICRASASWCWVPAPVPAAARTACESSARTSPRRWR